MRFLPLLPTAFLLAGCILPPAVMASGVGRVETGRFPHGTEAVEVPVEEGVALRGVFTPADPGAPVVLVLLGSGDSTSYVGGACPEIAFSLRERGFAALVLDYRGVAASEGSRSPGHLRGDARAAYAEAVRRAGSEERVVVRGMSLGTLAAAALLEEGKRPGAVVLVTPVRGETAAVHWAYASFWDPLVFLVVPFLRDVGDADLLAAVRGCRAPLLILSGDGDELLPPEEQAMVRDACAAAGGVFVRRPARSHQATYTEAIRVLPEEAAFLRRLFPATSSAAGR